MVVFCPTISRCGWKSLVFDLGDVERGLGPAQVRDPYDRWLSDVQFECRAGPASSRTVFYYIKKRGPGLGRAGGRVPTVNASLGVERTTRNRIAEGVVHRNVLGDSGDTGERLEGPRLAAAGFAL